MLKPGKVVGQYRDMREFIVRRGITQVYEVEIRETNYQKNYPRRLVLKVAEAEHQSYHRPAYAVKGSFENGWRWYDAMKLVGGDSLEPCLSHRPSTVGDLFCTHRASERRLPTVTTAGIVKLITLALDHNHHNQDANLDMSCSHKQCKTNNAQFSECNGIGNSSTSVASFTPTATYSLVKAPAWTASPDG